jgi:hypothetical protein
MTEAEFLRACANALNCSHNGLCDFAKTGRFQGVAENGTRIKLVVNAEGDFCDRLAVSLQGPGSATGEKQNRVCNRYVLVGASRSQPPGHILIAGIWFTIGKRSAQLQGQVEFYAGNMA